MTASELISLLEKYIEKEGDLEVKVWDRRWGDYSSVDGVSHSPPNECFEIEY